MLSSLQQREIGVEDRGPRLLVIDVSGAGTPELLSLLEERGYQVVAVHPGGEAAQILKRSRPALTVVAHGKADSASPDEDLTDLRTVSRSLGIPVLDILEPDTDLDRWVDESDELDDWIVRGGLPKELSARVAQLVRRSASEKEPEFAVRPQGSPIDAQFSSLVVHDMRSPLNVIGLSIRLIEQVIPREGLEIGEDLRFIEENVRQIERMLSQLSDFARLFENGLALAVSDFDPRRLVNELLENRTARPGFKLPAVQLDVQKSCPPEAALDQLRARMAIEYALINANAAAQDTPIRLTLRGIPNRLIVEVAVDRPPPSSVTSFDLRPQVFERLCGSAAERRGMDLAIAARISELFGGTARLEAVEGKGTTLIFDWPVRISDPATSR
jgi:signal transduction histidine kinase